ncbi:hypothetical protein CJ030_MR4G002181 [Morella rubra]|uniref:Uncharacterized protein n=1 Tax=Morella rubra TaxID=262757 RepID=A0A6A1VUH0_9ROSI|nr:hypothetical protein CJ030_MR4G002181 [Morella rubra]
MGKDRNGKLPRIRENSEEGEKTETLSKRNSGRMHEDSDSGNDSIERRSKSRGKARESSDLEGEEDGKNLGKSERKKRKLRRRYSSEEDSESECSDSESEDSGSDLDENASELESENEEERRRKKRRERKRREKEEEREEEKEEERERKEKEEERERRGEKEEREKEEEEGEREDRSGDELVGEVNMESLPNWEEKQMFKQFMEDHNTATFPSKKYYNLDAYYRSKMEKEMKKGVKKVLQKERTVFNDEEQRRLGNVGALSVISEGRGGLEERLHELEIHHERQELLREREKHKEEEVEALKRSMQSGMAQAMKEQAQLREEMAYQYKIGNLEAAAAIQRRLDPDVAM